MEQLEECKTLKIVTMAPTNKETVAMDCLVLLCYVFYLMLRCDRSKQNRCPLFIGTAKSNSPFTLRSLSITVCCEQTFVGLRKCADYENGTQF